MYNTEHLIRLCNGNNSVTNLYGKRQETVTLKTVRTKGQMTMERLFYVKDGCMKLELNDSEILYVKKGDILYLPPDVTYVSEWENAENGKTISIHFSIICDGEYYTISDKSFIIAKDKYGIYLNLFSNFIDIYEKGQLGYKVKCQSIFWDIFHMLLKDILHNVEKKDNSINKGILYIENNYMNKISIDDLAKMCYTSPSTFRRKFHQLTGMSPIEYKNKLKIIKASELLKTGQYSVAEAAREVNIDDIYYFSKMFKKYMGVTALSLIPADN